MKSANRGPTMVLVLLISFALAGRAGFSWDAGWFWPSVAGELVVATNLNVFVTDQLFDTNIFDFTTNYFQAYDVPLATNDNVSTLRMTDRAGNTTTTNFDVILNYAGATNAPLVTLIWPQDGLAVSSSSCTIRGTMSDETGTLLAQIVSNDGTNIVTNTVSGLIERNNMFWLENVPLNGTNQISIQAVDASGKNVAVTNFTVYPRHLILTINSTPTGDDLYQPFGPVSGTVSDPSVTVIVNGTNATVRPDVNDTGTYNWNADSVRIRGLGTATFDAAAYAMGVGGGGTPSRTPKRWPQLTWK